MNIQRLHFSTLILCLFFLGCSKEEQIGERKSKENFEELGIEFDSTFKIPIVVHLVDLDGDFLSNKEVKEIIYNINLYYNAKNSSLNSVFKPFQSIIGNPDVEFVLAKKDPFGAETNGITRTVSNKAFISNINENSDYLEMINSIIDLHGHWDGREYLNIIIANEIPGYGRVFGNDFEKDFGSYAVLPPHDTFFIGTNRFEESSMLTGVFAETSLGSPIKITNTLVHEIGHWLGLKHTYGYNLAQTEEGAKIMEKLINDNYDPNNTYYKMGDDGIDDTPWTCVTTDNVSFKLFNSYVNVENIMGKTNKLEKKMFTKGQVDSMHKVLRGDKGGRNNLWSNDNLTKTGVKVN